MNAGAPEQFGVSAGTLEVEMVHHFPCEAEGAEYLNTALRDGSIGITGESFGHRYLTRVGSHEVLEGTWKPTRVVIIEFPDKATIKAWYGSPEYQPLIAMRREASEDVLIVVEGK